MSGILVNKDNSERVPDRDPDFTPSVPPTTGEVVGNFLHQENPIPNTLELLVERARFLHKDEEGFNAEDHIKGHELYAHDLLDAKSTEEMNFKKAQIDKRNEGLALFAEGTPLQKGMAFVSLLATDPTIWIPIAAAANSVKGTSQILEVGLKSAAQAAAIESGREAVLQANQATRTPLEAGINITAAAVVTGILGSAMKGMKIKELEAIVPKLDDDLNGRLIPKEAEEAILKESQSVGAARETTLEDEGILGLKISQKVMKMMPPFMRSPLMELATAPSKIARQFGEAIGNIGLRRVKNLKVASEQSVESLMKLWEGTYYRSSVDMLDEFRAYKKRAKSGLPDMERMGSKKNGMLTEREFYTEVGKAASRGDKHIIPEVEKSAKIFRAYADKYKNAMVEVGIFKDADIDVDTAMSWILRKWRNDEIAKNPSELVDVFDDWLKKEKGLASDSIEGLEDQIGVAAKERSVLSQDVRTVEKVSRKSAVERVNKEINESIVEFDDDVIDSITSQVERKSPDAQAAQAEKRAIKGEMKKAISKEVDDALMPEVRNAIREDISRVEDVIFREGGEIDDDLLFDIIQREEFEMPGFGSAVDNSYSNIKQRVIRDVQNKLSKRNFKGKDGKPLTKEVFLQRLRAEAKKTARKSINKEVRNASKKLRKELFEKKTALKNLRKELKRMKGRANRSDLEIRRLANDIVDNLGLVHTSRLPYDDSPSAVGVKRPQGLRGSAKARVLKIPDEPVEPWLERDVRVIMETMRRTLAPDIELMRKFGTLDHTKFDKMVRDEITDLVENVRANKDLTEKQKRKQIRDLQKAKSLASKNIRDSWEKIRGSYAQPDDYTAPQHVLGRALMNFNFMRLMGDVVASSIPDLARPIMVHGIMRSYGDLIEAAMKDIKKLKIGVEDLKEMGVMLDLINSNTALARAGGDDFLAPLTKIDELGEAGSNTVALYSGINHWNSSLKTMSGLMSQNRMMKALIKLSKGEQIPKAEFLNLAQHGLDGRFAQEIAEQFAKHGENIDDFLIPNSRNWTNTAVKRRFQAAVRQQVDEIIVTPGLDKPLWLSEPGWDMVGQFKSFPFSALYRMSLAGLQQADMNALSGLLLSVFLGSQVYAYKTMMRGGEISDDPRVWITEGIDRSGAIGPFMDVNNILEKTTRGKVGINSLVGGPPMSRYQSRNIIGSLSGPSFGLVSSMAGLIGSTASHDFSESDTRTGRRLLPGQNLPYLRWLFDRSEEAFNKLFNIDV